MIPIQPNLFYVLIRPRRAPQRKGMIMLPEDTREADTATNTVGEVIALGDLAYKTKPAGLDYSQDTCAPRCGDWVRYAKHAGQPFKWRNPEAKDPDEAVERYVIVADTDILGVIPEGQVGQHVGWVS
jgi:hypothetical protein